MSKNKGRFLGTAKNEEYSNESTRTEGCYRYFKFRIKPGNIVGNLNLGNGTPVVFSGFHIPVLNIPLCQQQPTGNRAN
jgi:hypothetical protein